VRLLYSARSQHELIYREELREAEKEAGIDVRVTLTREQPAGWKGYDRRIDRDLIAEVAWPPSERPLAYICGPTSFVEAAADAMVSLGHEPSRVRTERFGPTGG
jgi:ferredoxin-NADP reductase